METTNRKKLTKGIKDTIEFNNLANDLGLTSKEAKEMDFTLNDLRAISRKTVIELGF